MAGLGGFQVNLGKTNSSQTATIVVIKKNSPWAPGHICGVSAMLVVVVVLLNIFLVLDAGTHQIRDQSRALEDRNDSNNFLEVHTPNSLF